MALGCVSIPGEAEGHPAVSVRWIPQAQREGNGREGRGVSTANLRAVLKTSQREAEPNGEPSVTLAEVCLVLLMVHLKHYLSNPFINLDVYLNLMLYYFLFRYEKDWSALQSFLERCEGVSGSETHFLPVDKLKLDGELLELKVIHHSCSS